jgi:hypothetical protein
MFYPNLVGIQYMFVLRHIIIYPFSYITYFALVVT